MQNRYRVPLHQPLWRIGIVVGFFALSFAVLTWKVIDIQVLDNEVLQEQGEKRTLRIDTIMATRGNIIDRHGRPLAVSTAAQSIFLNPKEVLKHPSQWELLSATLTRLGLDPEVIRARISQYAHQEFMYVKRHLSPTEAESVLSLGLKGVYAREEFKRYYPLGEAAVHVIGMTNTDEEGQEGIELQYENILRGIPGKHRLIKDSLSRVVQDLGVEQPAQPGQDITLSIDANLQYIAYRALKEAVTQRNAQSGTAIVLDVRTGEVLAMVSQPSFNPNNRSSMTENSLRNRVVTDVMEPGSTSKTFTMTAALMSGQFTSKTIIETSPGYTRAGRKVIKDPVDYGPSTLERILYKSSQVGATKVALAIGPEPIVNVLSKMGFGSSTGINFPGEASGSLPVQARWSKEEIATLGYGYGYQLTPLQLAHAYSIYANRGISKPVSLLKVDKVPEGERVIDSEIADTVVNMLRSVVNKKVGGTGVKAVIPGYSVAGKTGTTWFYDVDQGGYDNSNFTSHFAGIVPVDNPSVAIVVSIQRPQGEEFGGGQVSAPIFSEIAAGTMRLLQVSPESKAEEIKQSLQLTIANIGGEMQ
jgi:cell division protein FtsI (penicillin-binding protein 3)